MADDPKSGTGEGEVGAASASGTPPASGGETETAEQQIARLQAERDAAQKKFEDEHNLRLSQVARAEEANRIRREGSGAGNPSTRPADPLDQQIASLEEQIRALAAEGRRDAVAETLYMDKLSEREARNQQQRFAAALSAAKPVFDSLADRELAARAEELFRQGGFANAQFAITAAKGERYDNAENERRRLASVAEEREKELKRRAENAPQNPASGGSPTVRRDQMDFSEYERITKADPMGEGRKLRQRRDAGTLVLNMSR